jgi:hypothetical protein
MNFLSPDARVVQVFGWSALEYRLSPQNAAGGLISVKFWRKSVSGLRNFGFTTYTLRPPALRAVSAVVFNSSLEISYVSFI